LSIYKGIHTLLLGYWRLSY